jgi:predicted transcriptional regulator
MSDALAYAMKRTTVKIPDELEARLRREAARTGLTISEVTRSALSSYLGAPTAGERRDMLAAGAGRSGRSDLAQSIEEILAGEMT